MYNIKHVLLFLFYQGVLECEWLAQVTQKKKKKNIEKP